MTLPVEPVERGAEPGTPSDRPDDLAGLRRLLKVETGRLRIRHRFGLGGLEVARRRSDLVDQVIHRGCRMAAALFDPFLRPGLRRERLRGDRARRLRPPRAGARFRRGPAAPAPGPQRGRARVRAAAPAPALGRRADRRPQLPLRGANVWTSRSGTCPRARRWRRRAWSRAAPRSSGSSCAARVAGCASQAPLNAAYLDELMRRAPRAARRATGAPCACRSRTSRRAPAGLRDLHAVLWWSRARFGDGTLEALRGSGRLSAGEYASVRRAYDFLLRRAPRGPLRHGPARRPADAGPAAGGGPQPRLRGPPRAAAVRDPDARLLPARGGAAPVLPRLPAARRRPPPPRLRCAAGGGPSACARASSIPRGPAPSSAAARARCSKRLRSRRTRGWSRATS